ncbi:adenylate cyclase type 10-like [Platysternon megacephalum]|uniref:Adenylate cyclase type 10-like n=1 Tax=Platysternon megacephalum TaxID=55544 RepID=A0A4D9E2Y5_9SAUR|nr:adenylate cyclase type 10-like [Platysternon megacephalum]
MASAQSGPSSSSADVLLSIHRHSSIRQRIVGSTQRTRATSLQIFSFVLPKMGRDGELQGYGLSANEMLVHGDEQAKPIPFPECPIATESFLSLPAFHLPYTHEAPQMASLFPASLTPAHKSKCILIQARAP